VATTRTRASARSTPFQLHTAGVHAERVAPIVARPFVVGLAGSGETATSSTRAACLVGRRSRLVRRLRSRDLSNEENEAEARAAGSSLGSRFVPNGCRAPSASPRCCRRRWISAARWCCSWAVSRRRSGSTFSSSLRRRARGAARGRLVIAGAVPSAPVSSGSRAAAGRGLHVLGGARTCRASCARERLRLAVAARGCGRSPSRRSRRACPSSRPGHRRTREWRGMSARGPRPSGRSAGARSGDRAAPRGSRARPRSSRRRESAVRSTTHRSVRRSHAGRPRLAARLGEARS